MATQAKTSRRSSKDSPDANELLVLELQGEFEASPGPDSQR